ncbi:MAG: carboxypeptidase regulatory-like domain-containing protein [Desulfamplus sp.]|nr:carboxypeptidase regulatory-like domain-containing protein [Desulfamplus sp.]
MVSLIFGTPRDALFRASALLRYLFMVGLTLVLFFIFFPAMAGDVMGVTISNQSADVMGVTISNQSADVMGVTISNQSADEPGRAIFGRVVDELGMGVSNAVVRLQTTPVATITDGNGYFTLGDLPEGELKLTAWAKGFFITGPFLTHGGDCLYSGNDQDGGNGPHDGVDMNNGDAIYDEYDMHCGDDFMLMTLKSHSLEDNREYQWLSSYVQEGKEEDNCQRCHSNPDNENSLLPFDEWIRDAHATSAQNPRFLSMYLGTDLDGNQSPYRKFAWDRDYGLIPLPPDPGVPYYGPGFKLDFPALDGNCATCHAPLKAVLDPHATDASRLTGVDAEGVSCDFCHKIWDVSLDETTKLPRENMTGVLSYTYMRPPEGHQFFAGPLDDVAPGEDTYLPLQSESVFCAPCHHAVFGDTVIYNSYGEWLESPYSDPKTGQTCQECHMPLRGADHFALPEQGGLIRDTSTLRSHRMTGVDDALFMEEALSMDMEAAITSQGLSVQVTLTNDNTGHHVPTGNPMRHMILVVTALGHDGTELPLVNGPILPEWCGLGDDEDDFAGLPGMVYAKVLEDTWSREYPSGAYWNDIRLISDNRIAAYASDKTNYIFDVPIDGNVRVVANLYYRRAFKRIMEQKGWNIPDMTMKEIKIVIPVSHVGTEPPCPDFLDQENDMDGCIPPPETALHFMVKPSGVPVCSSIPAMMNPMGFGSAASGGQELDLRISLGCFTSEVDIFFAVMPPVSTGSDASISKDSNIIFLNSNSAFELLEGREITPWKRGISTQVDATLFSDMPLSPFPGGRYRFILLVTPSGMTAPCYIWETGFKLP